MTIRRVLASAITLAAMAVALGVAVSAQRSTEGPQHATTVGAAATPGSEGDVHVGTGG
jgi:hypothetical protein